MSFSYFLYSSYLDASYQMACLNYGLKVLKRICDLAKHYWHYVAAMNSMELLIKLSAPKQNLLQEVNIQVVIILRIYWARPSETRRSVCV